jgi:hypothetical protein
MAEPADLVLPLLREMRTESAKNFATVENRLNKIENRLNKMDETLVTFRHALSADSLLSKIVTGEFEERLGARERRLRELETHK